ncbi:MAG: hypothetical protein ACRETG_11095 [Steroidobacteraceae bacterium]
MSMTQIVIGTALGFMISQGALYGARQFVGWMQRGELRVRIRTLTPSGPAILAGFVRYAPPLGVSAALVTLGVWAIGDYLAAKSARSAALASVSEPAPAAPTSDRTGSPQAAGSARALEVPAPEGTPEAAVDPYADSAFKVQRRVHRAGTPVSLRETLVLRSEARARADLLRETQQHLQRSQYDCEAAVHADKYVKAGLDVWGFEAWQSKYFPMDGYKGARLPQCKDIKSVVAPSLDLRSTVARENRA